MASSKKKVIIRKKKGGGKGASRKDPHPKGNETSDVDRIGIKKRRLVPASTQRTDTASDSGNLSASRTRPVEDPENEQKFKFYCVWCAQKLSAYNYWAGRELPCPSCKSVINIPRNPPKKDAGK